MGIFGISSSGTPNDFEDDFLTDPDGPGGFTGAEDGSRWEALRSSVWSILSGKAKTTSLPTDYPVAAIYSIPDSPLDQDVVITLKGTTPGSGAALWISETGDWWGVTTGRDAGENCDCDTCSTCTAGNCNAGYCITPGNCNAGPCTQPGNQFINAYVPGNYNPLGGNSQNPYYPAFTNPTTGGNIANYNCNAWNTGNCNANSPCSQLGEPVQTGGGNCRAWKNTNPNRGSCTATNPRNFSRPCVAWSCDRTGNRYCRASSANRNPTVPGNFVPASGGGWNPYNFGGTTNPPTGGNPTGVWNCAGTYCSGVYNCVAYTCTAWTCTTTTFSDCNCSTCFPTYIRVIRRIGEDVSQLIKWKIDLLGTQIVNSMRITTSGPQITIEPYANADLTSKIGSDLVYTPTGVALTSFYGIIVEPSPTSQGYEIDEITIEKI
jgi:hypothetical protein